MYDIYFLVCRKLSKKRGMDWTELEKTVDSGEIILSTIRNKIRIGNKIWSEM